MVTVALAGASTGFGLTMLRVFLSLNATTEPRKHNIVLLSRTPQLALSHLGVQVRPIDYTSHASLVAALSGVHTVLSTIGGSGEALLHAQLALLAAAKEAGVKRFAPSEYAGTGEVSGIDLYKPKEEVWRAVKASGLEYTKFSCGLFMSIFATGTPKGVTEVGVREGAGSGEQEALAGLRPWDFVVNMRAGTADLPGDGRSAVVFTEIRDVAKFVWRALELESWPAELGMQGDRLTWREAVDICEEAQRRKWLIKENGREDMQREMEVDQGKAFYNQVRIAFMGGQSDVPGTMNELFPEVEAVTVRTFVEKWWAGVELPESKWEGESQSFNFK